MSGTTTTTTGHAVVQQRERTSAAGGEGVRCSVLRSDDARSQPRPQGSRRARSARSCWHTALSTRPRTPAN